MAAKRKKAAKTESMQPESDRAEAAPDELRQIAEPTVEPESAPVKGAPAESGKEEINEDLPVKPAPRRRMPKIHDEDGCHCYDSSFPKGKLPPPPILLARELEESERPKPKTGKDGLDKAMEILDEYYEGVPLRDPKYDQSRED